MLYTKCKLQRYLKSYGLALQPTTSLELLEDAQFQSFFMFRIKLACFGGGATYPLYLSALASGPSTRLDAAAKEASLSPSRILNCITN
jgi:hypothetical protein